MTCSTTQEKKEIKNVQNVGQTILRVLSTIIGVIIAVVMLLHSQTRRRVHLYSFLVVFYALGVGVV